MQRRKYTTRVITLRTQGLPLRGKYFDYVPNQRTLAGEDAQISRDDLLKHHPGGNSRVSPIRSTFSMSNINGISAKDNNVARNDSQIHVCLFIDILGTFRYK